MLTDGVDSQKFADCSNGAGMTALHVAAMKGSPQVRQLAKSRRTSSSLCILQTAVMDWSWHRQFHMSVGDHSVKGHADTQQLQTCMMAHCLPLQVLLGTAPQASALKLQPSLLRCCITLSAGRCKVYDCGAGCDGAGPAWGQRVSPDHGQQSDALALPRINGAAHCGCPGVPHSCPSPAGGPGAGPRCAACPAVGL